MNILGVFVLFAFSWYSVPCTGKQECPAGRLNDIVRENCAHVGSPRSEWDINGSGDPAIQGFATTFGNTPGNAVTFKIKSISDHYRLDIYRLGYYQGHGARLVTTIAPSATLPQAQPACTEEASTLLYDCGNWLPSAVWRIPTNATSGVYIARLVREDAMVGPGAAWRTDYSQQTADAKFSRPGADVAPHDAAELGHSYGQQKRERGAPNLRNALREPRASHVYFVVRDLHQRSDIIFQTSDTTWAAYNRYGGTSTYGSYKPTDPRQRCYKASYNRPIENRDYRAINLIFGAEYPGIRFLERNGYDVSYWTGIDTHLYGAELLGQQHKVFVSVGHDEYWSREQRVNVERARDTYGTHLQFWSGNEVFWKIRWEHSHSEDTSGARHGRTHRGTEEPRTMVCYKETQEIEKMDPMEHVWTGTFRDARRINPEGANPENSLTGQLFTVNAWRHDPLLVPRRFARNPMWQGAVKVEELLQQDPFVEAESIGYSGNQQQYGAVIEPWAVLKQGVLGHEWDEDIDNGFRPNGMVRLSSTTVDNVVYIQDSGSTYDTGSGTHTLTLYRAGAPSVQEQCVDATNDQEQQCTTSSALVFGAGTVQWTWGLDPVHDNEHGLISQTQNSYDTRIGVDLTGPDQAVQQATVNLFAMMGNVQPQTLEQGLVHGIAHTLDAQDWQEKMPCEVFVNASTRVVQVTISDTSTEHIVGAAEVFSPMTKKWCVMEPDMEFYSRAWQSYLDARQVDPTTTAHTFDTDPSFGRRWIKYFHTTNTTVDQKRVVQQEEPWLCRYTNAVGIHLSPAYGGN